MDWRAYGGGGKKGSESGVGMVTVGSGRLYWVPIDSGIYGGEVRWEAGRLGRGLSFFPLLPCTGGLVGVDGEREGDWVVKVDCVVKAGGEE